LTQSPDATREVQGEEPGTVGHAMEGAGTGPDAAPERAGSSSSSSDEEEDEASRQLWAKVEAVLAEYHLSRFALAAAKRWVRLMGDPSNTHLRRIKDWLLLKINNRARAKPSNSWQAGCPDIVPVRGNPAP